MSALGADLLARGDLNDDDLRWDLTHLWNPVDNAVLLRRPREIAGRER